MTKKTKVQKLKGRPLVSLTIKSFPTLDDHRRKIRYRRINRLAYCLDFLASSYLSMLGFGSLHHQLGFVPAVSLRTSMTIIFTLWALTPVGVFNVTKIKNLLEVEKDHSK